MLMLLITFFFSEGVLIKVNFSLKVCNSDPSSGSGEDDGEMYTELLFSDRRRSHRHQPRQSLETNP